MNRLARDSEKTRQRDREMSICVHNCGALLYISSSNKRFNRRAQADSLHAIVRGSFVDAFNARRIFFAVLTGVCETNSWTRTRNEISTRSIISLTRECFIWAGPAMPANGWRPGSREIFRCPLKWQSSIISEPRASFLRSVPLIRLRIAGGRYQLERPFLDEIVP